MSTQGAASSTFLGTGWSFPPAFGPGGREVAMVSDEADVHQALAILFATRRGERLMQEGYGCNLDELLFEEADQALVNRVVSLIHDAVLRHETRVRLHGVSVSRDPLQDGALRVELDYSIRGANSRYNLVFPFYLNEAKAPGL